MLMSATLSPPKQDALLDHHKILPWPDLGDTSDFNPDHYLNDFDDIPGVDGEDLLQQQQNESHGQPAPIPPPEVAAQSNPTHQTPEHGDRSSSLSPPPDSSVEQSRREEEEEDEGTAAHKQSSNTTNHDSLSRPLTPLSPLSPPPQEEEEEETNNGSSEDKKEASEEDRKPSAKAGTSTSPAPAQPPPENDPKAPLLIDLNNELFAIVQALLSKGLPHSDRSEERRVGKECRN